MQTILVSSHRIVDRLHYKADLLTALAERGDVTLLYAGGGVRDYWREARRRSPAEVVHKLSASARPAARPARFRLNAQRRGSAARRGGEGSRGARRSDLP